MLSYVSFFYTNYEEGAAFLSTKTLQKLLQKSPLLLTESQGDKWQEF